MCAERRLKNLLLLVRILEQNAFFDRYWVKVGKLLILLAESFLKI